MDINFGFNLDQSRKCVFYKFNFVSGKYEYLSPYISTLTGYSWDELNNIGIKAIVKKIETTGSADNEKCVNCYTEYSARYFIEAKDGTLKLVEDRAYTELDSEVKEKTSNGVLIDITDQSENKKVEKIITQILDAANTESDLNEFFEFIHSSISEVMPAKNFYIALYESSDDTLSFPYFVDEADKSISPKKLGNGLTEYVIKKGKTCLIDAQKNEELEKLGEIDIIWTPAKIWLGIPLKIKDYTFGVLVVQDYNSSYIYGEQEKNILELISYAIARAIERKRNEHEKNKLIRELKALNLSKDKLISHISHDLRSPFNSLLGFSEILTSEYDTLTRDEIQEYLQVIYEASKNLFGMTNNLLQFSRFQMGRLEHKPSNLKLLKIINRNINLLKGNAIKKQINFMLDVDKNIEVYADEDMLGSIIQNLVSNAIKFTPRRGDITVSAKHSDADGFIEMAVQDSGLGMSVDDLQKVFGEKFYSTPGTEREYGTGLGLLLVKEFVERNGGQLRIYSKPGIGSTFYLTIPIVKKL